MLNRVIRCFAVLCVVCLLVTGCSQDRSATWVIGSKGSLSAADKGDAKLAKNVAASYMNAWIKEDYKTIYALQSRQAVTKYQVFHKLAVAWRTKGFNHREALTPGNAKQIISTMEPVLKISDAQAQILLSLGATGKNAEAEIQSKRWLGATGKNAEAEIQSKRWPERVLVMHVTIAADKSILLLTKENGTWKMLYTPGQARSEDLKL